jgi:hypothetical protein
MLSATGGSISWASGIPYAWLLVAVVVAVLVIFAAGKAWPESVSLLTVVALFLTAVVGFLQWQILSTTEETIKTDQRPWVGLAEIDPIRESRGSSKVVAYHIDTLNIGKSPALKQIFALSGVQEIAPNIRA